MYHRLQKGEFIKICPYLEYVNKSRSLFMEDAKMGTVIEIIVGLNVVWIIGGIEYDSYLESFSFKNTLRT